MGSSNNNQQYIETWQKEKSHRLEQEGILQEDRPREEPPQEKLFREVHLREKPQNHFHPQDQELLALKEDILMEHLQKVSRKQQPQRKAHLSVRRKLLQEPQPVLLLRNQPFQNQNQQRKAQPVVLEEDQRKVTLQKCMLLKMHSISNVQIRRRKRSSKPLPTILPKTKSRRSPKMENQLLTTIKQ